MCKPSSQAQRYTLLPSSVHNNSFCTWKEWSWKLKEKESFTLWTEVVFPVSCRSSGRVKKSAGNRKHCRTHQTKTHCMFLCWQRPSQCKIEARELWVMLVLILQHASTACSIKSCTQWKGQVKGTISACCGYASSFCCLYYGVIAPVMDQPQIIPNVKKHCQCICIGSNPNIQSKEMNHLLRKGSRMVLY